MTDDSWLKPMDDRIAQLREETARIRKTMKTKTDTQGVKHITWVTKPEGSLVYDDAFWVKAQSWGTFVSVGADDLEIITSLTEDQCVSATRWYLKCRQEGFPEETNSYDSTVGGKL
jgi:hypothetical protein